MSNSTGHRVMVGWSSVSSLPPHAECFVVIKPLIRYDLTFHQLILNLSSFFSSCFSARLLSSILLLLLFLVIPVSPLLPLVYKCLPLKHHLPTLPLSLSLSSFSLTSLSCFLRLSHCSLFSLFPPSVPSGWANLIRSVVPVRGLKHHSCLLQLARPLTNTSQHWGVPLSELFIKWRRRGMGGQGVAPILYPDFLISFPFLSLIFPYFPPFSTFTPSFSLLPDFSTIRKRTISVNAPGVNKNILLFLYLLF